jgi:hypothetical protein
MLSLEAQYSQHQELQRKGRSAIVVHYNIAHCKVVGIMMLCGNKITTITNREAKGGSGGKGGWYSEAPLSFTIETL